MNGKTNVITKILVVTLVACVGLMGNTFGETQISFSQNENTPLNVILVVTDDQRYDTLWAMENVRKELSSRGVEFTEGFVTTPICCPSRASILTGQYSHHTGVIRNAPPYGGTQGFKESKKDGNTLSFWLQNKGYKTALFGKYLNGYHFVSPYVPRGWNKWVATTHDNVLKADNGRGFTKFSVSIDGGEMVNKTTDYSTDFLFDESLKFIADNNNRPFFIYLTPYAPHGPALPAKQDEGAFSDFRHRPKSYNEEDVSDKTNPTMQGKEPLTVKQQEKLDEFARNQLRCLQSVDRGMKRMIDTLISKDLLKNTIIVYTSDNGYLWGEHRVDKKQFPYEEAIRVPFVIYAPGINGGRVDRENLILNIDIAPTILELAGIEKPQDVKFDGTSIVPVLKNPGTRLRDEFWIEFIPQDWLKEKGFYGIRTTQFKLIEYLTGDREFYDLKEDPFELKNQYENPTYKDTIAKLDVKVGALKREVQQFFSEEEAKAGVVSGYYASFKTLVRRFISYFHEEGDDDE